MKKLAIIVFLFAIRALGQGTFQNLDFESANVSAFPRGSVPIANAMPGWVGYLGVISTSTVFYDDVSIGGAAISLQSTNSILAPNVSPIAGRYSALLQSSVGIEPSTAAVAQTGQIPATAASLQFYGASFMLVTFGGQLLPLVELGTGPGYQIMGADISAFAGQTGELKFSVPRTGPIGVMTSSYLDNIFFSNQQVPEPSAFGLIGLGALLFGYHLRQFGKS